ncbi:hypothetical protein BDZ97DRAFT_2054146 [Flammula alnicola]|nr:hypothetical protein BDZ97DRAFT_2054146 [Flammula alnicola]
MNNPHNAVCPDFDSEDFVDQRKTFIDLGLTNEQAVTSLSAAWKRTNEISIAAWDQNINAENAAAEAILLQRQADEQAAILLKEQERLDAEKEDRRKNKHKCAEVHADLPIPKGESYLYPPAVMSKLKKWEYIPLYHFTNAGLDAVDFNPNSENNNIGKLIKNDDGSIEWQAVTSSRSTASVKKDKDISINDFCIATPRFIRAMHDASWPQDRITMFTLFWDAVQRHDWRSSRVSNETKALMWYQDDERQKWHAHASTAEPTTKLYSLAIIDESRLQKALLKVEAAEREQVFLQGERDRVSIPSSQIKAHIANHYMLFFPLSLKMLQFWPAPATATLLSRADVPVCLSARKGEGPISARPHLL